MSGQEKELIFEDLTPVEVPVTIGGKRYKLREADGETAVKYRNAAAACTKIGTGGKFSELRGVGDLEPLLVSLCLVDEAGNRVPESTVRTWPNRVQRALFDRAKEISHLGEEEPSDEASLRAKLADTQEKLDALTAAKETPGPN
jgi:hypothetical protein